MFTALRTFQSRAARTTMLVLLTLAAGAGTACSADRVVGPVVEVAPAQSTTALLGSVGVIPTQALLRTTPLKRAITRSLKLTADGGTIVIPEAGVTLTVPPDAIDTKTLTISITALAGNAVAYSFAPHGTRFRRPLTLTQDLATTTWATNSSWMLLSGGYFKDEAQVNTTTGKALVDETLPVAVAGTRSYLGIWHFSGYMISMD